MSLPKKCKVEFPDHQCPIQTVCDKPGGKCTNIKDDGSIMFQDISNCCYIPQWQSVVRSYDEGGSIWVKNQCGTKMYETGKTHRWIREYIECAPNKSLEGYSDNNNKIYSSNFSGIGIY